MSARPTLAALGAEPVEDDDGSSAAAAGSESRPFNDTGNSVRFVKRFGNYVHYVPKLKSFANWDAHRWKILGHSERGPLIELAKKVVAEIEAQALTEPDPKHAEALRKFAVRSGNLKSLENMIEASKGAADIELDADSLDRKSLLFNLTNGTFDFDDGKLRKPDPDDLLTALCPYPYNPRAKAPRWEKTLAAIFPDKRTREFFQIAMGYSMTGLQTEMCLFLMHGPTHTGKSTVTNAIRNALGPDYSFTAKKTLLIAKKDHDPMRDYANVRGKRFVEMSETDESHRIDEVQLKELTGADNLNGAKLYENQFNFVPTHHLWLRTNHLPKIRGNDDAVWGRIRVIPFTKQFFDRQDNKTLSDALAAEAEGILAWMIRGALKYLATLKKSGGRGSGLPQASVVVTATKTYRADQDSVGTYFDQHCEAVKGGSIKKSDFCEAFNAWLVKQKYNEWHPVTIGQRLAGALQSRRIDADGKDKDGDRAILGYRLKRKF